jgi:putative transposase
MEVSFLIKVRRNEDEWRELYKIYNSSGLNLTAWCRENKIGKTTMYKNVTLFDKEEVKAPEWVPVIIEKDNKIDIVKESLVLYIKEVSISIKDGFNKKTLEDVLEVITKVC